MDSAAIEAARPLPRHSDEAAPRDGALPEPPVIGEGGLRLLERPFLWLERLFASALPEPLNPIAQTGAIAVLAFIIACVSGVLVLFWYDTSVHTAYESIRLMEAQRFGGGMVRSLHRYSSDAAMLFVVIHATRLFLQRRFGGARTLAWVTGIILIVSLWGVGWLGYWLVWDERAQQVALGTARMVDVLPVFADPLSRSFLTDAGVNTLLFFVVFFMHMLLPLGMGIPLWLHITRLSRPRFLTRLPLAAWVTGSLVTISILVPAGAAGPARMALAPSGFDLDAWYLLPLALTDRLGAGALWTLFLGGTALLISPPFWMQRGRAKPASLDLDKCNGCTLCAQDCPYDAIRMVPRTDGRSFEVQAQVDPARCVGCGICAGACSPGGIGLDALPVAQVRRTTEAWIDDELGQGNVPHVAFVCSSSAGGALKVDARGRSEAMPGYRVVQIPCAGWLHAITVERAIRRGAERVLVAGCGPGEGMYREGAKWMQARLAGDREPELRTKFVDASKVAYVALDASRPRELSERAAALRVAPAPARRWPRPVRAALGAGLAAVLLGIVVFGSRVPYAAPAAGPELVVAFKHPGHAGQHCRPVTEEENAKLPPHMRRKEICERGRADVRLQVKVDGQVVLDRRYEARGLSKDGNSVGLERLPVTAGAHEVEVALSDDGLEDKWTFRDARRIEARAGARQVVQFDRVAGFSWEGG